MAYPRRSVFLAFLALLAAWLLAAVSVAVTPAGASARPDGGPPGVPYVTTVRVVDAQPRTWTVRSGQTLSRIAASAYGNPALWPALWWVNRTHVRNPDLILTGQVLTLSTWHPQAGWLYKAAMKAIPAAPRTVAVHYAAVTEPAMSNAPVTATSSFQACVIARESGGNAQVMNSTGHYGLYQFSYDTWKAYGGSPALFGHASAAYQTQIFDNAIAQGGQSNWSPYDGC